MNKNHYCIDYKSIIIISLFIIILCICVYLYYINRFNIVIILLITLIIILLIYIILNNNNNNNNKVDIYDDTKFDNNINNTNNSKIMDALSYIIYKLKDKNGDLMVGRKNEYLIDKHRKFDGDDDYNIIDIDDFYNNNPYNKHNPYSKHNKNNKHNEYNECYHNNKSNEKSNLLNDDQGGLYKYEHGIVKYS